VEAKTIKKGRMKAIHVYISGKVQGVFYRANTKQKAQELGIKGWVKNRIDGRVEAFFQGEEEEVQKMISWCWKGSPAAEVDDVMVEEEKCQELQSFKIKR
jgi:acylphosphatase